MRLHQVILTDEDEKESIIHGIYVLLFSWIRNFCCYPKRMSSDIRFFVVVAVVWYGSFTFYAQVP